MICIVSGRLSGVAILPGKRAKTSDILLDIINRRGYFQTKESEILNNMLLSKTCIYAIRSILLIASRSQAGEFISTRKVADELGISFHFLAKVTHTLIEAGLIKSYRGPNGGVGLAKEASNIRLVDVIEATDGMNGFDKCLLGLPTCSTDDPCPLHKTWRDASELLLKEFRSKSIKDIIESSETLRLKG